MKKKLLSLLLALLVLTTTALAARYADEGGTVRDGDENAYYALEPAATPVPAGGRAALPRLGNPENLRWDPEVHGRVLWDTTGPFLGEVIIRFYSMDNPFSFADVTHKYGASYQETSFSDDRFLASFSHNTGDFYFTVKNIGDFKTYTASAEVSSLDMPGGVYHFTPPGEETALEAPARGHWEWPAAVWDDRRDTDGHIRTYEIEYGYSQEKLENLDGLDPYNNEFGFRSIGTHYSVRRSGEEDSWLQKRLLAENGAGWYYFRVRPISADIEQWRNGHWSPWSGGYNLLEASQKITDSLNAIGKAKPEDIRSQIQSLNKTELKNALTADIQGAETGTEAALTALENALGGPAKAAVAPELAGAFGADGVSIVGAALNNVTGDEAPTLNIGSPKQENHVRDELYNSTLAVDFSMTLENVESPHELAVPVKVTLPIPAAINPEFLAILHYKADGSFTEVAHVTFQKGGQWYASFVLTGFSDFTLTQTVPKEGPPAFLTAPDGRWQAVNVPEGARLLLARYEEGRFQSAEELSTLSGTLEGSGKLFLLDREGRPLCPAASL